MFSNTFTDSLKSSLTDTVTSSLDTGFAVVPWQPTDLSSLIGWWDASDETTVLETTTAGRVKTWNDKSGNGNHVTVAGSANEPKTGNNTINGLNVIDFGDGGAHYLDPVGDRTGSIAAVDARDISIHIVGRRSVTDSQGGILSLKQSVGSDFIATDFNTTGNSYFPENTGGGTSYLIDTPSTFTNGTAFLFGMNANGDDMKYYNAGTEIIATGAGASANHFDGFVMGYRDSSSRLWIGDIAEIIVANAVSTADRQNIEGYLSDKWGV